MIYDTEYLYWFIIFAYVLFYIKKNVNFQDEIKEDFEDEIKEDFEDEIKEDFEDEIKDEDFEKENIILEEERCPQKCFKTFFDLLYHFSLWYKIN